jgi:hypothetical protein
MADAIVPNLFNPQSWNRYAYCLNNPLIYTDPTGHEAGIGFGSMTGYLSDTGLGDYSFGIRDVCTLVSIGLTAFIGGHR